MMAVFDNSREVTTKGITYLGAMAQVDCPRCGIPWIIRRNALDKRFSRGDKRPMHCNDCRWIASQFHED